MNSQAYSVDHPRRSRRVANRQVIAPELINANDAVPQNEEALLHVGEIQRLRNELNQVRQVAQQLTRRGRPSAQQIQARQHLQVLENAVAQAEDIAIARVAREDPSLFQHIERLRNQFIEARHIAEQLICPGRPSAQRIQAQQRQQEAQNLLTIALQQLDQVY